MRGTPRALCSAARAAWRQSFPLDGRDVARWFPGHMAKGEVLARGGRARLRARVCAAGPRAPGSSLAACERVRLRRAAGRAGPGADWISESQEGSPSALFPKASLSTSVFKKK